MSVTTLILHTFYTRLPNPRCGRKALFVPLQKESTPLTVWIMGVKMKAIRVFFGVILLIAFTKWLIKPSSRRSK